MTVTHVLTMTLLVTGTLSFYLVLHAAIDLLRHRGEGKDAKRQPSGPRA